MAANEGGNNSQSNKPNVESSSPTHHQPIMNNTMIQTVLPFQSQTLNKLLPNMVLSSSTGDKYYLVSKRCMMCNNFLHKISETPRPGVTCSLYRCSSCLEKLLKKTQTKLEKYLDILDDLKYDFTDSSDEDDDKNLDE